MQKFQVTYHEVRETYYVIEANSEDEARKLFSDRLKTDDAFFDQVKNDCNFNLVGTSIEARMVSDNAHVDLTYAEMKEGLEGD